MIKETQFKTEFPWRAVIIAIVIFILSIFSALNLFVQTESYGFKELFFSVFAILVLLYLLFFMNINIIEFQKDRILVNRPFRFVNSQSEIPFSLVDIVYFKHVAIGVPRLVFRLKKGKRIRIRFYQIGGRKELRKIVQLFRDNGVRLVVKRFGSQKQE